MSYLLNKCEILFIYLKKINKMKDESDLVLSLFLISCSCSIIASFFTIFLYFKYRHVSQNFPARLVVLISLTDGLLWADRFINLISKLSLGNSFEEQNNDYCIFSSIFRCIMVLFNLCCVFLIAFSLFWEIVLYKKAERIETWGYIISLLFSFVMAFIPYIFDDYGVLDPYQCWITQQPMNMLVFYTPLIVVFLFNLICVAYIITVLKTLQGHFGSHKIMMKFMMFPSILVIAWLPGLIRIAGNMNGVVIDGLMYIFMPLQGILNPFIYGSIFSIVKNEFFGGKQQNQIRINQPAIENQSNSYDDLMRINRSRQSDNLLVA